MIKKLCLFASFALFLTLYGCSYIISSPKIGTLQSVAQLSTFKFAPGEFLYLPALSHRVKLNEMVVFGNDYIYFEEPLATIYKNVTHSVLLANGASLDTNSTVLVSAEIAELSLNAYGFTGIKLFFVVQHSLSDSASKNLLFSKNYHVSSDNFHMWSTDDVSEHVATLMQQTAEQFASDVQRWCSK